MLTSPIIYAQAFELDYVPGNVLCTRIIDRISAFTELIFQWVRDCGGGGKDVHLAWEGEVRMRKGPRSEGEGCATSRRPTQRPVET